MSTGPYDQSFSPAFDVQAAAVEPPPDVPAMPVPYAGCLWPIDPACRTEAWEALDPDVAERALAMASATLHRLSGYRVGGCPITVRPCIKGCQTSMRPSYLDMMGAYGYGWWPHIEGGVWVNSCGCAGQCSCTTLCEVSLPRPVGEVVEVKVDGAVLAETDYRLDGDQLLWVGAGPCPWPVCQNLAAADTQVGTFAVTYLNSYPVDALGAYAAGVLAMEFAKACTGSGKCRLPAGTTTVVRQGVSFDIVAGAFPDGLTGIREVDTVIALWNPAGLRQATRVWSPDLVSARVVGGS